MTDLTVRGACRTFAGDHAALKGADLDLAPGSVTALLGPSGSGKSTLLRAIAGLERLDAGEIRFGDTLWSGAGAHLAPEQRKVGLVFQDYALFPHMNALDNVAFGLTGADRKARALAQLNAAELGEKARKFPHELSGGEQQRVALARALAPEPALVLLDEPFSGLDRRLRGAVRARTVAALKAAGAAALIVTHDAEEALDAADTLALMLDGVIVQTGTPEDVWFKPVSAAAARLVGDANILEGRVETGEVTTPFGPLACDGFGQDTPVDVIIRPAGLCAIDGDEFEVVESRYAGSERQLSLKANDGSLWRANAPAASALRAGDRTGLELDTAFAHISPKG
ncbi:ABC transporter ATP-binding protein [Maricaulis sp.]|uniref:ABC transporter ATP-binding protein n=1 Tax=Maricaulis sp. TaxID=1486257 RepID=UPI00260A59EA|nr:ABC transporter ATP-binding protein [Maricaulis sp.]